MLTRTLLFISSLAVGVIPATSGHTDRRVVDTVLAGDAESETEHGFAAYDGFAGVSDGKPHRQARGWMRYALTTFDDTQVTVSCTFVRTGSAPLAYDIIVEDSLVATRTFAATSDAPVVVEIAVPFSVTKGRTNIAVIIRGRGGLTPALRELRTIQDHHEVLSTSSTMRVADAALVSRSTIAKQTSRSHPLGVTR